jgi:hypothetical protein
MNFMLFAWHEHVPQLLLGALEKLAPLLLLLLRTHSHASFDFAVCPINTLSMCKLHACNKRIGIPDGHRIDIKLTFRKN